MTGAAAIRKGVKEGIDDARLTDHTQQIAAKLGGDPSGLTARVEALEAEVVRLDSVADNHMHSIEFNGRRLERHRLRIRWLERWAHILWPGWFPRPGL